ncbi:hypothetical protein BR93DRAFT_94459 [Coniochaeta sp. PMI_546]|nr:hypothetical protein BR93DRAFT_94459 [Coniochaeta sp. PMI_546]
MSSLPIPPPRTALHLYRHLLREATYLPPAVRPFFWDRIYTRFRLHQNDPEPAARIQKAHKDLRYLRSANAGHTLRMRRILMMGFGRTGRRRRELISDLVSKAESQVADADNNNASVRTDGARDPSDEDVFWDDWLAGWDKAKVLALARAQASVDLPEIPLPTSKITDPHKLVPTENIWGKPLAKKLARSKLRKEYKSLIKRLLPPVEDSEWELLRSLATGQAGPEYTVPKRRAVAINRGAREDKWEWESYVLNPVRAVDANRSRKLKSLSGEVDDTSPFPRSAMGVHRFTDRSWRRLYADIWRMTATMERREDQQKWDTKWGKLELKIPGPTAPQAEFFDGIPSTGKFQNTAKRSTHG